MSAAVPITAVVPTKDRPEAFTQMLRSLAMQDVQPQVLIVIDGSSDERTANICRNAHAGARYRIEYSKASVVGAAAQRNQGVRAVSTPYVLFTEDDVVFEAGCIGKLWEAAQADNRLGGVNALIVNQQYGRPSLLTRLFFGILNGRMLPTYAGLCIGPALNILPADDAQMPDITTVQWLNLGCTLYRTESLPNPPFPPLFHGYSLLEDVTLSLTVGRNWELKTVRSARIVHNSQPGVHKSNPAVLARMELVNRHYVMTTVMGRRRFLDYFRLAMLELFQIANGARSWSSIRKLPSVLKGKIIGVTDIVALAWRGQRL